MGDKIVILAIEFLYGRLFQIDLHNEAKDEYYRLFVDAETFYNMLNSAKEKGGEG